MEYAFPNAWDQSRRGFWNKRRRSVTSLFAVIALVAGIAVAFKLFDRTVPNNIVRDASKFDFQVHVQRAPSQCSQTVPSDTQWCIASGTNPIYRAGVDTFPGDTRNEQVRIRNTNTLPKKDASFEMYVDQSSITVNGCTLPIAPNGACAATPVILTTDPNWSAFVNFWTLEVTKETFMVLPEPIGEIPDGRGSPDTYVTACQGELTSITPTSRCKLGIVRAQGATNANTEDRLDERNYQFAMSEEDPNVDQSFYKGWTITFGFVFEARLPAEDDSISQIQR